MLSSGASIDSVMDLLDPLLDDFHAVAKHGVDTYLNGYSLAVRMEHTKRTGANCIYDHMVAEWERRIIEREYIKIKPMDLKGLKLWLIGDQEDVVIRWKKMAGDGATRNYQTKQARRFDRNKPLEGLADGPMRITVGYFLDGVGALQRAQVARPNRLNRYHVVDWCAAIIPPEERKDTERKWQDVTMQKRLAG
jgi:hypothetical protein